MRRMKRSTINQLIAQASEAFAAAGFLLPPWSTWSPETWATNLGQSRDDYAEVIDAALGWDVTDFGSGDFESQGLLLFTLRNGTSNGSPRIPYAEKIMLVRERQVTPMHFHRSKTEDIINRSGAELVIKLHPATREETLGDEPAIVFIDGVRTQVAGGDTVRLQPGQSITLYPYLYHAFWAEGGTCVVGEVSSVNDDDADNRFLDAVRFSSIDEDEDARYLLCNEYPGA
jgi:D-lyxose ketol-isomerase